MPEPIKVVPAGAPPAQAGLARRIELARSDVELAQGLHIRMTIEGGHADEKYSFHFEASGGGLLSLKMSCRMTGREARAPVQAISPEDFAGLLRMVDVNKLLEVRRPWGRIPPCSLLGRIEITSGQQRVSFVFMADRAQAEAAGLVPPPDVTGFVNRVFDLSAKYSGGRDALSLRP